MNITLAEIENAFKPSKEIDNAQEFAGRKKFIERSYSGLLSEGSHIALIGNRGIGKTSLAKQIINIANGDNEILNKLDIFNETKLDFLSIYHACGGNVNNVDDLLYKLITTTALSNWIYDIPKAKKYLLELGINFGPIQTKASGVIENEKSINRHNIDIIFQNIINIISDTGVAKNGILIVLDEFDQIKNSQGFATLIKSLSTNTPNLKFCIVGVAHDINTLLTEHQSTDRLFAGNILSLPPMNNDEIKEIIDNAESKIDKTITFSDDSRDYLCQLANGHPYLVHLIGKYSLREAYLSNKFDLGKGDVYQTLNFISQNSIDPILEGRYKTAITYSAPREIVLKVLASHQKEDGEIFTTDAYKDAIDAGVENPSQYVGQLGTDEYGSEIIKIRERYYRFKDSLFHAYVKAHPHLLKLGEDKNYA